jgi:nitrogen fixation NifU-like protein
MKLYLKIEEKNKVKYIKDIKFQTLGCGAAIATSSMITVMVKQQPLDKAEKISKAALIKALGGLPSPKIHCSVLAVDALKKAIRNYLSKGQ